MGIFKCNHKGCSNNKHQAKGYCNKHYLQYKKHGQTRNNTEKDFNEIVHIKNHVELILTNKKGREVGRAKLDKDDLLKVQIIGRWTLDSRGYVYNNSTGQFMHRVILNPDDTEFVDHIKIGIKYRSDNRRKNIRIATGNQNQFNTKLRATNTSGFKGVSFNKSKSKWVASIRVNAKITFLGYFDTPESASIAYQKEAKIKHKEFYCNQ